MSESGSRIERIVRAASHALTLVAALCVVLMMLQMTIDVVLKYFFNAPIKGNLEIVSYYYMVGVVFLPLAMVEFRHEHINVDLFVRHFGNRTQSYIYVFGCLISAVFFAILAYQTLLDAINSTERGEILMGAALVPIWPSRWALPVGFFLILLAVLIHAWRALRCPDSFDPVPEPPEVDAGTGA